MVGRRNLFGQPLSLLRQGKFNQVPMILGHNGYEGNLFAIINLQVPPSVKVSDSEYFAIVNKSFEIWGVGDEVLEWYSQIKQDNGNWIAYSNEVGDFSITCGTVLAAESIVKSSSIPLYVYIFNYIPKNWPFAFLNSTHGVELAFVWNNTALIGDSGFTEQEEVLSNRMMTSWGSFAYTSQPGIADWKVFADANEVAFLWDVNSDGPVDFSRDICSNWISLFTT